MTLEEMKSVDPRTVDRGTLVQRSCVKSMPGGSKEERIREFIRQIKNPYCYIDGDIVVKISFSDNGKTMEDCMRNYFSGL